MTPAPDAENNILRLQNEVEDECGIYVERKLPLVKLEEIARQKMLQKLNMNANELPAYPRFTTYEERLRSFKNWPVGIEVSPEALSDAGLFYSSQGDRTYCFYCGGMLQHWNNHDVPWAEHARWYPNCKYVSQVWENIVTDNVSNMKTTIETIQKLVASIDIQKVNPKEMKSALETLKVIVSAVDVDKLDAWNDTQESLVDDGSSCQHAVSADKTECMPNNEKLSMSCLICLTGSRNALLLPCCHIATCCDCATKLKNCCVCRKPVTYHQRVYIS